MDKVLKDDRVRHAIEKMTMQQFEDSDRDDDEFYNDLVTSNEKRARKLLFDMKATLTDDFLLRYESMCNRINNICYCRRFAIIYLLCQ